MFAAVTLGDVSIADATIEHVVEDVESLNRRARSGEFEVSCVSAATYALVADRYRLCDVGASMVRAHGPVLVAREAIDLRDVPDKVVAIPGSHTTASLLLRLYTADEPALIEVPSDKILEAVLDGQADLGVLIHEGDLAYRARGLVGVLDFADAWRRDTDLPLPLGVTIVRRDLDEEVQRRISRAFRDSIRWARANLDDALAHARRFARGMDETTCREFVLTRVDDHALTLEVAGHAALERLYAEAHRRRLVAATPPLDAVS